MNDTVEQLVKGHRDAVTVKRVFGDPYKQNGVTIIPAAKVMGGGGGGAGESPGQGQGSGTGFGIMSKPAGAYVITGDVVKWTPAVDVNRIIAGAFFVASLALAMAMRKR